MECKSGTGLTASMKRFFDIINELELRDLLLVRGPLTWCGRQNNLSLSRLDRLLVFEGWFKVPDHDLFLTICLSC